MSNPPGRPIEIRIITGASVFAGRGRACPLACRFFEIGDEIGGMRLGTWRGGAYARQHSPTHGRSPLHMELLPFHPSLMVRCLAALSARAIWFGKRLPFGAGGRAALVSIDPPIHPGKNVEIADP